MNAPDSTALVPQGPIPLPRLVTELGPIGTALEAVDRPQRLAWMRGLGFRQLAALFELCESNPCTVDDLVGGEGEVRIADGKNGLLLFSGFQKRFARIGDEVVGYNHNSAIATWVVGAGHFVAENSPEREGEVWINYLEVPKAQHPEFPPVRGNDWFPAFLAYGDMIDIVRRVCSDMFIGKSIKPSGRWGLNGGQYFALTTRGA